MGDIRPNTLSAPGEREARSRVEAAFKAIDRCSPGDLERMPVPRLEGERREMARARAIELAARLGRRNLLDDATGAVRDAVLARLANRLPGPYGTYPGSSARVEDQATLVAVLQDLVAAAVVEDALDPADTAVLTSPGGFLLHDACDDGAQLPVAREPGGRDHQLVGAPSEADWLAADRQARPRPAPPPGTRAMRRAFFGVAGVMGVAAAIAMGATAGDWLLAIALAGAVVALCWTFATWTPRT